MKDIMLFRNEKIKPLRLKPQKLVKTAVDLAIVGVAVGLGLGAYKTLKGN